MARIRSCKPEYWTSEQVVECSPIARLLFVGMWNFADDGGVLKASAKTLKMQIFPADDLTVSDIEGMVEELITNGLLIEYEHEKVRYWWVTGWHHQKIDRPTYKYPGPLNPQNLVEPSTNTRRDESTSPRRALDEPSPPEGKGREGKGEEGKTEDANASLSPETGDGEPAKEPPPDNPPTQPSAAIPICPANRIVEIYNRTCTSLPNARYDSWSEPNKRKLRARWKWLMSRPIDGEEGGPTFAEDIDAALAWWERFFRFVQEQCPHLVGDNDRGWTADLLWLICPTNFDKVKGGSYRRAPARAAR